VKGIVMFQALFKRAEATVDSVIASAVARVVVATPFIIAAGFATAALAAVVYRELGATVGNLVMAGLFCLVGIGAALALFWPGSTAAEDEGQTTLSSDASAAEMAEAEPLLAAADRELLSAAVKTVGPIAVPLMARMVVRNLPLVAAVAAAAFVMSRDKHEAEVVRMQAAE
jgi:hypothetical protein